jgi:hypothetical protein
MQLTRASSHSRTFWTHMNAQKMWAAVAFAVLLSPTITFAQSRARGTPSASVEGDVYLVMQSGDTKKGAGLTVALSPDGPTLREALSSGCRAYYFELDRLARELVQALGAQNDLLRKKIEDIQAQRETDESAMVEAKARSDSLMARIKTTAPAAAELVAAKAAALASGRGSTGMNAHYRITGVTPGAYVASAMWRIGDQTHIWWKPVRVIGRDVVADLDNEAATDLNALCKPFKPAE